MQIGQLTSDVSIGSTGFSRSAGGTIAENEVPPEVWKAWVAGGIVVLPVVNEINRKARMRAKRRKRAIPP